MEITIIDAENPGGKDLHHEVQKVFDPNDEHVRFELKNTGAMRAPGVDHSVLVAIVSGTTSALTALIMGLFQLLERRKPRGPITIERSDGTKIMIPAGTSREEVDYLIGKVKELDVDLIRLR